MRPQLVFECVFPNSKRCVLLNVSLKCFGTLLVDVRVGEFKTAKIGPVYHIARPTGMTKRACKKQFKGQTEVTNRAYSVRWGGSIKIWTGFSFFSSQKTVYLKTVRMNQNNSKLFSDGLMIYKIQD